jgi:hypothetical protein
VGYLVIERDRLEGFLGFPDGCLLDPVFRLLIEVLGTESLLDGVDRLAHAGPGALDLNPGDFYLDVEGGVRDHRLRLEGLRGRI